MSAPQGETLARAIRAALLTGPARAKVFAARQVARDWRLGRLAAVYDVATVSYTHLTLPTIYSV